MRFPGLNDGNGTYLKLGRYSGSRTKADPQVASLATLITKPQAGLVDAMAASNAAEDRLTDAQAIRDYHLDGMNALIMDYGRKAFAHFGSRTDKGYLKLLPEAPSTLVATTDEHRKDVYEKFQRRIASPQAPGELKPLVKPLGEAWKRVTDAEAVIAEARSGVDAAGEGIAEARVAWMEGYRRLHARLIDRYPSDKPRVECYFRSPPAVRRAPKPAVAADKAGPGQPKG